MRVLDREKVILNMNIAKAVLCNPNMITPETCIMIGQTISDALSLLKEQEARVMTLEEVKAFDWDYCYLEEERLPGNEYRAVCGDYALTCITWPCVTSMRTQHGDENYGRKWRCWSAKPTDEQRRSVKWG